MFSSNNTVLEYLKSADTYDIIDMHKLSVFVEEAKMKKKYLDQHSQAIWQDADGAWNTHIKDKDGKRLLRKRKTRKELEDVLVAHYKEQEETIRIADVFQMWIDEKLKFNEIQKGSYDRYSVDFHRFFSPNCPISKKNFENITEEDLEYFIKSRIAELKLTRKTYSGLAILINGIFKYGKHKGYTDISITNFMGDIQISNRAFSRKVKDKHLEVFSEDEIPLLRNYLRDHADIWNLALTLQFQTGMRIGEISGLMWEDVEPGCIHVKRTEHKYRDEKTGKWTVAVKEFPKTEAGQRDIILPPQAAQTIEAIRSLNPDGEYVFMSNGKRIRENTFNKRLSDICEKLGIEHRTTHKIRKTYGTMLLDGDVNDSFVAEQMGHKDVSTTRKLYYYSSKRESTKKAQIARVIDF